MEVLMNVIQREPQPPRKHQASIPVDLDHHLKVHGKGAGAPLYIDPGHSARICEDAAIPSLLKIW